MSRSRKGTLLLSTLVVMAGVLLMAAPAEAVYYPFNQTYLPYQSTYAYYCRGYRFVVTNPTVTVTHLAVTGPTNGMTVKLWTDSGSQLASATMPTNTTGWRVVALSTPVALSSGTAYRLSAKSSSGYRYGPANGWSGDGNIQYTNYVYYYCGSTTAHYFPTYTSTSTYVYGFPDIGYTTLPPPPAPGSITVPSQSTSGNYTVSWTSASTATSYELQEDVNASFSTAQTVYTGTALTHNISGKQNGTYYYRVRGINLGGAGAWRSETTGCTVILIPGAPSSLTVPATSSTGNYSVYWSSSPGATSYELQESTNGGSSWTTVLTGAALSFALTGQPDGSYTYRVRASNIAGNSGWTNGSNACVVLHPPSAPPAITVPFSDTDGSYVVSWTASSTSGVTYRFEEDTDPNFAGATTVTLYLGAGLSYTVGSPTPNQNGTYYYRVRSELGGKVSGWTYGGNPCTVQLPPPPAPGNLWFEDPSGTVVIRTTTSPDIDGNYEVVWSQVLGSTTYQLEEATDPGFTGALTVYSGTANTFTVSGKAGMPPNGVTYYYRVRAGNSSGWSSWRANTVGCHVEIPQPGVVPTITVEDPLGTPAVQPDQDGSYSVVWGAATGATYYVVEEATNATFAGAAIVYQGSSTDVQLSGKPNGVYYYRVEAWNSSGRSGTYTTYSTGIQVLLVPPVPQTLNVPASSATGVYQVTWTSSATAASYELEESPDGSSWSNVYTGGLTYFDVTGRPDGSYYYRIRAVNASGPSNWNQASNPCVVLFPPAVPATITVPATSSTGTYTVSWGSSATATKYELEESPDGSTWSVVYTSPTSSTPPTQYTVTGKISGTYEYRVRAWNSSGYSAGYRVGGNPCVIVPPPVPTGLTCPASSSTGNWVVSWNSASGATSYILNESPDGSSWTQLYAGPNLSYTVTGKTTGTFYYQVAAVNGAGTSAYSASVTCAMVPPAAPSTVTVPNSSISGYYSVSWSSSVGATSYVLEEAVNGGAWSVVFSGNANSVFLTGRTGTTASPNIYTYRAKASNAVGDSAYAAGSNSCTVTLQSPSQPSGITVPASSVTGSYTVSWNSVWGATGYELQEATQGDFSDAQTIYSGGNLSYYVTAKANGLYYYRVRSTNPVGSSPYTAGINACVVTLLPPTAPANFNVPFSSFSGIYSLNWTAGSGAMWYEIEEDVDPNFGSPKVVYVGGNLKHWVLGQTNGTYHYRIRSVNTVGASAWRTGSNSCMVAVVSPAVGLISGLSNPRYTREQPGATDVPMLQMRIAVGEGGNVQIESLTVTGSGTGNEQTGVQAVKLWNDANGDGIVNTGDTQIGTAMTYTVDNGTVTFSGLTEGLAAGQVYNWLVTYDFYATAVINQDYQVQVAASGDMTVQDLVYNGYIVPQGTPVQGGIKRLASMGSGDLQVFEGEHSPEGRTMLPGGANVEMQQLNLVASSVEDVTLSSLRLWAIGDGDDLNDVTLVTVLQDNNGDGHLDGSDTTLGTGNYNSNNGSLTVTFTSPLTITAGGSVKILVLYDFASAVVGTFSYAPGILTGSDVVADGVTSGQPVSVLGTPVVSKYVVLSTPPAPEAKIDPEYSMGGCAGGPAGPGGPLGWVIPFLMLGMAAVVVSRRLRTEGR